MRPSYSLRLEWASFAACAVAWIVLCWPWLVGGMTIPYDAKAHFHAQLQFLANAFHSGQSPFWNPNAFAGSPQIADPQSLIFSPAVLIAMLSPQPSLGVIDAYTFLLLGIAAMSILAFCLDRGWHPAGGLVAAIAFSFGASAAWRVQHIGQIQSYAFFAVALWTLARAMHRRSALWGAAAGAAAAMMIVEPDQVAFLGCYVLAGYVVAEALAAPRPFATARELAPVIGVATLVGAAIALVPVVLTILFVEESSRPEVPLLEAARGSLHPASLLTAVVGDLYGALDPKVEYWGPYSESWDPSNLTLSQNMSQLYVGALPVWLLLTLGFLRRELFRLEVVAFAVALGLLVLYALGIFTPAYRLMYTWLPGVSLFRRPSDATFLVGGLLAILGGYLVHRVASGGIPAPGADHRRGHLALAVVIFGASLAIAWKEHHLTDALKPVLLAAAGLAIAAVATVALARFGRSAPVACMAVVAALTTADLAVNNGPNESTALPSKSYDLLDPNSPNETIKLLKQALKQPPGSPRRDRVELAGLGFEWPNAGLVHGFDHDLGYNPLRLDVVSRAIGAGDTIAGWEQRQFTALFPSYRSSMADLLGLRFIATPVPVSLIDKKLKPNDLVPIARTKDAFVYENRNALPRALLVGQWMRADFDEMVTTGEWPPFDPRSTVLLESGPAPVTVRQTFDDRNGGARAPIGEISMPVYTNTQIEIDVATPVAGLVVLNDAWHPWWRATVDGEPSEILKANVMFRAVAVPPGRHRVTFTFEPLAGALAEIDRRGSITAVASRKRKLGPPRS